MRVRTLQNSNCNPFPPLQEGWKRGRWVKGKPKREKELSLEQNFRFLSLFLVFFRITLTFIYTSLCESFLSLFFFFSSYSNCKRDAMDRWPLIALAACCSFNRVARLYYFYFVVCVGCSVFSCVNFFPFFFFFFLLLSHSMRIVCSILLSSSFTAVRFVLAQEKE